MTLVDLYQQVLDRLEVTAAGEAAAPEDTKVVRDKYPLLYDMLLTLNLVSWSASEDVPDFSVIPLTSMLAFACAKEFGKNPLDFVDGALNLNPPSLAERQLRLQLARTYISHPVQSEYF